MVILKDINFSYNKIQIIKNFSLKIKEGSFTTLLGASGCGKTTILRLIAGFLKCSSGEIYIDNEKVNNIQPDKRKIGYVFQDFALFPHMTVFKNLEYGLKENKFSKTERAEKISEISHILQIEHLLERYPDELSGGQQQRIALGRALILQPKVLLMDEPLSSLDTNLRKELREELLNITKKFNITTIYVTHDQEEAMSMSDKIAVIENGTLIETGTPGKLYFNPENIFTAKFTGDVNIIEYHNKKIMLRPEWMEITEQPSSENIQGVINSIQFLGKTIRLKIQYNSQLISLDLPSLSYKNNSVGQSVNIKLKNFNVL